MDAQPLFSYRGGNSLIHKMPALLKLCLLLLLPTAAFFFAAQMVPAVHPAQYRIVGLCGLFPRSSIKRPQTHPVLRRFSCVYPSGRVHNGRRRFDKATYTFNPAPHLRAAGYIALFLHDDFARIKTGARKNPSEKNIAAFRFVFSLYSDSFFGMGANGTVVESARREKFPEKTLCFAPGLYFRSFF